MKVFGNGARGVWGGDGIKNVRVWYVSVCQVILQGQ